MNGEKPFLKSFFLNVQLKINRKWKWVCCLKNEEKERVSEGGYYS